MCACQQAAAAASGGGVGCTERIVAPTWSTRLQTAAAAAGAAETGRQRAGWLGAAAARLGRPGSARSARHRLVQSSSVSGSCGRLLPLLPPAGCPGPPDMQAAGLMGTSERLAALCWIRFACVRPRCGRSPAARRCRCARSLPQLAINTLGGLHTFCQVRNASVVAMGAALLAACIEQRCAGRCRP